MKIIVQKFGGTSVRDSRGRSFALKHIKKAIEDGYKSVVVVSAMGRKGEPYATDTLLSLVDFPATHISKKEQDLLLSCGETISSIVFSNMLNQEGISALAITGAQAGFRTNADFTNAKILEMKTDKLKAALMDYDVIVVAGFQGMTKDGEITTLGRGGSDTSASALGVAIGAEFVDIFTDVEGVMTADPRIVEDARPLDLVSYTEICNMAYQGAKVIHPRAVEIAMHGKVPIRVRSTYSEGLGTLVTSLGKEARGRYVKDRLITGIAHTTGISQIKVFPKEGTYENLHVQVFKAMAQAEISVDFINISPNGIVYTVSEDVIDKAVDVLQSIGFDPQVNHHCAKVAVVGASMTGVPGVTAKIVTAISEKGISILQSADSHTTIWVLVKENEMKDAVNALHKAFQLDETTLEKNE